MPRVTQQKTRQILLVTGEPYDDITVLERMQLFNEEGQPLMIGGSYTRATMEHSTGSLTTMSEEEDSISVAPGWRAFEVTTNRPARVRVYRTAAQRTADLNRGVGTRPFGNHGRLLEVVTIPGLLGVDLSPTVDFMSDTGDNLFYISVQNRDSVTGIVTVTFDYVRTE